MTSEPGLRDLPELDPLIHARARMRVTAAFSALEPRDRLAFPRLQELLGLTAGNLSTHVSKLEQAGYVKVDKTFRSRTPVTWLPLTKKGRRAFEDYQEALRAYLDAASPRPNDRTNRSEQKTRGPDGDGGLHQR
jgi:DNA-binding MarR family transcriptional regulator